MTPGNLLTELGKKMSTDSEMLDFLQRNYAVLAIEGFEGEKEWKEGNSDAPLGDTIWRLDLGTSIKGATSDNPITTELVYRASTVRGAIQLAMDARKGRG